MTKGFSSFGLEHTCGFMTVVAVYTPSEDHELRDKEQFCHKLDSVVGNVLVFLGNFNAEKGSDESK